MIENIKLVIDALGTAASVVLAITAIIALRIAVKQNKINKKAIDRIVIYTVLIAIKI